MVLRLDELINVLHMEEAVGLGADAHRDQGEIVSSHRLIAGLAQQTKDEITAGPFVPKEDPVTGDITYHIA